MALMFDRMDDTYSEYYDKKFFTSFEQYQTSPIPLLKIKSKKELQESSTLYVGNLSFYTTEEQIWELFSRVGSLRRIIMGLDRMMKTPCGFCFVEYYNRLDAEAAKQTLHGTLLDDRTIRTDWDPGFKDGRQYGRGKSGGQVRDEYRQTYDPGRGGYGPALQNVEPETNINKRAEFEQGGPPTKQPRVKEG